MSDVYPKSLIETPGISPRLGIKSSFSKIKRNIALLYLLWEANDEKVDYCFFEQRDNDTKLQVKQSYLDSVFRYVESYINTTAGPISISEFGEEIMDFELLKDQIEQLQVAFQLLWPLAKIKFEDDTFPDSKERTGKARFSKRFIFTSNIDLLKYSFEGQESLYKTLLSKWLTEKTDGWSLNKSEFSGSESDLEQADEKLCKILSILSDNTVFRLRQESDNVFFRKEGIYRALSSEDSVDIVGDDESKGPLRILKSAVSENVEPYIVSESSRKKVHLKSEYNDSKTWIGDYAERILTNLELSRVDLSEGKETTVQNTNPGAKSIVGKNIIYYGAPGTGKSYGITNYIRENGYPDYDAQEGNDNVFRVTLHPEYEYSDFVGQLMPVVTDKDNDKDSSNEKITYGYKEGIFTLALKQAYANLKSEKPVFLIMEELSRANVAAVFGDLFQLLDRDETGKSEYAINNQLLSEKAAGGNKSDTVFIPSNMTIIGTVNTSDQNVFAMDTAFKRRFEWRYVSTLPVRDFNNNPNILIHGIDHPVTCTWQMFYSTLNNFIVDELQLSEDKQIGPYFIKFPKNDSEQAKIRINNLIRDKLLQYLWDDVAAVARMSSNKPLFIKSIRSFSKLYKEYNAGKQVFSNDFIETLKKAVDEGKNETGD